MLDRLVKLSKVFTSFNKVKLASIMKAISLS